MFFFANPYNQHNFFTVDALARAGSVFIICPPLQLQLFLGRWTNRPRTVWLGILPLCLQLWCIGLYLLLRLRLITHQLYIDFITSACSIVAIHRPGLIWVHYQDYIVLSDQARICIAADICEIIVKTDTHSPNWESTKQAASRASLIISPNVASLHPIIDDFFPANSCIAPYGGNKSDFLNFSFLRPELDLIHDNNFVISARANSYRKGLDIFLDALVILARNHLVFYPINIDAMICGKISDSKAYNHYLRVKSALSLNTNVSLTAIKLSPKSYAKQLSKSDIFIMPSRCEGMSLAALEALWLGVPSILSSNCGVSGFHPVRHGRELKVLDPSLLADYIGKLIFQRSLLPTIRKNLKVDAPKFRWHSYYYGYASALSFAEKKGILGYNPKLSPRKQTSRICKLED